MTISVPASQWRVLPEPPGTYEIQKSLGCSRLAACLLVRRGLTTPSLAKAFLQPDFDTLADPLLLPDSVKAIRRLMVALDRGETIYVYGDYDADGITSAALWTRLLERLGGHVCAHVPHRRDDGYDLRGKVVETAQEIGAKVILTADCGIQRIDEVAAARRRGIDVIITDHHEVGTSLPPAIAVVNPHRSDSRYPFRHLAGVGVSYRLAEALVRTVGLPVPKYRAAFAELAAIGTVTDIMPLLGDNRVFVKAGLREMSETRRKGLRALLRLVGLEGRPLTSQDISFLIGPRLNAVGRVDDPKKALDLLLTREEQEASGLAAELEQANQSRRAEEQRILDLAEEQICTHRLDRRRCLVLASEGWHPGVIGIVANRLVERYGRPAILIALDPDTGQGRGSARSIPAFNMHDALLACSQHLSEFGGHSHAAGFTITAEEVEPFRRAILDYAGAVLRDEDLQSVVEIDAEVSPSAVTIELLEELARFEPYGHDNEEPLFAAFDVRVVEAFRIGRDRTHLKLRILHRSERITEAVMWSGGELADVLHPDSRLDICFRARLNCYNGQCMPQLTIVHLRHADGSAVGRQADGDG